LGFFNRLKSTQIIPFESDILVAIKLYLDTSVYNRPFDDQRQPRIWLETLSFALILQMVQTGEIELASSAALEYENAKNPHSLRRRWVERCLRLAQHAALIDQGIIRRAKSLESRGIKALDALHLACAEAMRCDYLVTCDDRLVRQKDVAEVSIVTPLEFVGGIGA